MHRLPAKAEESESMSDSSEEDLYDPYAYQPRHQPCQLAPNHVRPRLRQRRGLVAVRRAVEAIEGIEDNGMGPGCVQLATRRTEQGEQDWVYSDLEEGIDYKQELEDMTVKWDIWVPPVIDSDPASHPDYRSSLSESSSAATREVDSHSKPSMSVHTAAPGDVKSPKQSRSSERLAIVSQWRSTAQIYDSDPIRATGLRFRRPRAEDEASENEQDMLMNIEALDSLDDLETFSSLSSLIGLTGKSNQTSRQASSPSSAQQTQSQKSTIDFKSQWTNRWLLNPSPRQQSNETIANVGVEPRDHGISLLHGCKHLMDSWALGKNKK